MRNWIIGAAAFLAVAAPSVAAAQSSGYVGGIYSNVDVEGADDEADAWGVEGAVAFAGSGSIVFEVDAAVVDSDEGGTGTGLTGHVYSRNDSHLFGGFVGLTDSDDTDTTWFVGLEAAKYFADWTLAGAVAYGNNDDAEADGWGVNAEARYFVHDNLRFDAGVGYGSVDFAGGEDDALTYGVGGEYQFNAFPISIAAGYTRLETDETDFESDAITVGVRYNWGGTLRDRDRNGPSQASVAGVAGL